MIFSGARFSEAGGVSASVVGSERRGDAVGSGVGSSIFSVCRGEGSLTASSAGEGERASADGVAVTVGDTG